jgi:hypothetical protein
MQKVQFLENEQPIKRKQTRIRTRKTIESNPLAGISKEWA